jgi:hypothetical protein
MGADAVHHLYLGRGSSVLGSVTQFASQTFVGEFKRAYPEAKLIGVEPLIEKKKAEGLVFDGGKVECITPKCGLKSE